MKSPQGSGVNTTSLKQNVSNSLHFRGVEVLSVMFVPPAAEYSEYSIATELKQMLKMENEELMSVFGIIGSVFRKRFFAFNEKQSRVA